MYSCDTPSMRWKAMEVTGRTHQSVLFSCSSRLNEYPQSANRAAEGRACLHLGCGGTVETKYHHIGQSRFAAKYGIMATGGTFLDSQVV
jgi:hypothetical protein